MKDPILVGGIGNVFMRDDGFGCEVVKRLNAGELPPGVAAVDYGTGGPKQQENLYTRAMLEQAFGDFTDVNIVEEERELAEGFAHAGMSAVINLTARKPGRTT